jgi:hypothetical protein
MTAYNIQIQISQSIQEFFGEYKVTLKLMNHLNPLDLCNY